MAARKNQAEAAVIEAPETEADNRSKRQQWREGTTVTLTEKGSTNPKKPKSMAAERYDILLRVVGNRKEPPTVADLMKAGYRMDDVRHDSSHGFIELNQPFEL